MSCLPPIIKHLEECDNILLLGAGGGFDIYGAIPLYESLISQGKRVFLANYSFTDKLEDHLVTASSCCPSLTKELTPFVIPVTKETTTTQDYFPEKSLATSLNTTVYAIRLLPPEYVYIGLQVLTYYLNISTIICVDCGCDALLYGDEGIHRGSPYEDMSTMTAVLHLKNSNDITNAWLLCTSVTSEDMSLQTFFHHVQDQTKHQGFLGAFSLGPDSKNLYNHCLSNIDAKHRSIPNESVLAAMQGCFGEHYINERLHEKISDTHDFPPVTPNTSMYWFFDIPVVENRSPLLKHLYHYFLQSISTPDCDFLDSQPQIVQRSIMFNQTIQRFFADQEQVSHDQSLQ